MFQHVRQRNDVEAVGVSRTDAAVEGFDARQSQHRLPPLIHDADQLSARELPAWAQAVEALDQVAVGAAEVEQPPLLRELPYTGSCATGSASAGRCPSPGRRSWAPPLALMIDVVVAGACSAMACQSGVAVFCTARALRAQRIFRHANHWLDIGGHQPKRRSLLDERLQFRRAADMTGDPQDHFSGQKRPGPPLATVSTSARLMYWFTGRVRIRSAWRSVMGKSPVLCPKARAASCR